MSVPRSERLLNLVILLLTARGYVSLNQIKETIEGYREYKNTTDTDFKRIFERDKKELRSLGIALERKIEGVDEDTTSYYRIPKDYSLLPEINFSKEEAAVLALAGGIWQEANIAKQANSALIKLQAAGLEISHDRPMLNAHLAPREASFEKLWEGVTKRRIALFKYRGKKELRKVEPWHLAFRTNSWYLFGFDLVREDERIFKLSRITSEVKLGKSNSLKVKKIDPEELTKAIQYEHASITVELAIRNNRAPSLRRRGLRIDKPVPAGYGAWKVEISHQDPVSEIASYGSDVGVIAPAEFRQQVIEHLQKVTK